MKTKLFYEKKLNHISKTGRTLKLERIAEQTIVNFQKRERTWVTVMEGRKLLFKRIYSRL